MNTNALEKKITDVFKELGSRITHIEFTPAVKPDVKPVKQAAWSIGGLCVHKHLEDEGFNITHVDSGRAIVQGYHDSKAAVLGMVLAVYSLQSETNPFISMLPVEKIEKNRTARRIAKFLHHHRRVWNNVETEKIAGVFHRDRRDCELLRWKISKLCPHEFLDDFAMPSEADIGKMICGIL
jgi:hypothetical protein